jgi:sigma54-dependent transcription regulator
VRQAVLAYLAPRSGEQRPDPTPLKHVREEQVVKVTLRLPAGHAALMNFQACIANVSQSIYVAALIEGAPPPRNHAQAVAALQASTNRLAVISTDLSAYLRILHMVKPGASQELERFRAGIKTLNEDIRRHLDTAAELVAELRATRRPK